MAETFAQAFARARREKGAGQTFTWNGKSYSTNRADDKPAAAAKSTAPASSPRPAAKPATRPAATAASAPGGTRGRRPQGDRPAATAAPAAPRGRRPQGDRPAAATPARARPAAAPASRPTPPNARPARPSSPNANLRQRPLSLAQQAGRAAAEQDRQKALLRSNTRDANGNPRRRPRGGRS